MNAQAMEVPTGSELIKKLARGEISRKEFDLFLEMLDDKSKAETLEEGFWILFTEFLSDKNSDEKKDDTKNNSNTL